MPAFPATAAFASDSGIKQFNEAAAQTFKIGAAVVLDGSQNVTECGADPALILGFAAHPATKNLPATTDLIQVANEGQKFWMAGNTNPVYADTNVKYGIIKDANGIWTVDKTDVVNTRVYVHYVDLDRNLYLVSVLVANRQAI